MSKIIPHLWYDKEATQAAEFYTSIFPDSHITHTSVIHNTPSGDCDIVSFTVLGQEFQAISAGPIFTFTPSISFMINFDPSVDEDAATRIDEVWEKLIEGGKALMPLDEYPFSKRYGWVQDKFGLSWQLILTNPEGEDRPRIIPSLLFTQAVKGKAEEAMKFYLSIFKDSKQGALVHYEQDDQFNKKGTVMFEDFKLEDTWFAAMDSGMDHDHTFNEAISFIVQCDTQEEIDYFWNALSAVPEAEQCGWLKDKFGVSWQIVPKQMNEFMQSGDQEKIDRVTKAFLEMKKFDIAQLNKAYEG